MWILVVIIMAQPYSVERIEVLGSFQDVKKCESEKVRAVTLGLPNNMNIGCLKLEGVDLAYGQRTHGAL